MNDDQKKAESEQHWATHLTSAFVGGVVFAIGFGLTVAACKAAANAINGK
jgi:hypothetical protein